MRSNKAAVTSPRVEAAIAAVMKRYPGQTKGALARYFEAVHQELAPLARTLELETIALREQLEIQASQFQAQRSTPQAEQRCTGTPDGQKAPDAGNVNPQTASRLSRGKVIPIQPQQDPEQDGLVPLPEKMPASIYRHETLGDLYDRLAVHSYAVGYALQCLAAMPRPRPGLTAEHRLLLENAIAALDAGVEPGSEHANDLRYVLTNTAAKPKNCQTGWADICAAATQDNVTCPADSCDIDDGVRKLIQADAAQATLNEAAVRELATEHCHSVSSNGDDQECETAWEFTDDSLLDFTRALLRLADSDTSAPATPGAAIDAEDAMARVEALFKNRLTPFGMLVRALRIAANTTLHEMARHMVMSSADVSSLEVGRKEVTPDHVGAAAKFFYRYGIDTLSPLTAALQANGEALANPGTAQQKTDASHG